MFQEYLTCEKIVINTFSDFKSGGGFFINLQAFCLGLIPIPSSVIMAQVSGGTLNYVIQVFIKSLEKVISIK